MKNNIIKSELYEWRKIKDLQPKGFKTSLRDEVLKATLQKHGVSRSFSVWQDSKGDVYCIDGHQRKRVLEELENEGVEVPELLMCEFIQADNKKQASVILIEVFNQKHSEMDFFEFEKFVDIEELDLGLDLDDLMLKFEEEDVVEDIEEHEQTGGELSNMIAFSITDEEHEEWVTIKENIQIKNDKKAFYYLLSQYKNLEQ